MLDWVALNEWKDSREDRMVQEHRRWEGPTNGSMGPEVLPVGAVVWLQGGGGLSHGFTGGYWMTRGGGVDLLLRHRPHAIRIEGPARAGDVLKKLSLQVTTEVYRNTLLRSLADTVRDSVSFAKGPAGMLKGHVAGDGMRREMKELKRSVGRGADEDDDQNPKECLYEHLGMSDEWLLKNFGKFVLPGNTSRRYIQQHQQQACSLFLDVTEGSDPLEDLTFDELEDLVEVYCGRAGQGGSTFLLGVVPETHPKYPKGQLPGSPGEGVFCALWSDPYF
ncbi:hypothetical protein FOA52_004545 [Chlamydomonas sp. UWO 241]|nr:hypothetical protein FOA52_004545 [Chlamydomonas sp. UWO 241]